MKVFCLMLIVMVLTVLAFSQTVKIHVSRPKPDPRNFYGICWRGTPHDNLVYARQMGYEYVFYQKGMEFDTLSNGLYFYVETPEYHIYSREIDPKRKYTDKEIDFYEKYCVLKDTSADFPDNLATGWFSGHELEKFTVHLNFQSNKIITWAINNIINYAKDIEIRNPNFHFAGYAWDEPRPGGDFWEMKNGKRYPVSLERWNKEDRSAKINFEKNDTLFQSYTEGHFEFYRQLFKETRLIYPDAHFISEPYNIYEGWISLVQNRKDIKTIMPDILCQEGPGTGFADDKRIFFSGLISKKDILCTTPNVFSEEGNRLIAAKAAVNGSGMAWYGRFGGTGEMPDYKSITEVPARLKLIRMLPGWENANGTPQHKRLWDGINYKSENANVNPDLIAVVQPRTKKIFAVFLTMDGIVSFPGKKKLVSIVNTNDLFIGVKKADKDFIIQGNTIKPRFDEVLGTCYILTTD